MRQNGGQIPILDYGEGKSFFFQRHINYFDMKFGRWVGTFEVIDCVKFRGKILWNDGEIEV